MRTGIDRKSLPLTCEDRQFSLDQPQVVGHGVQVGSQREFRQRILQFRVRTAWAFGQRPQDGKVIAPQLTREQSFSLLAQGRSGAQKQPLAYLLRPRFPLRDGVQAVGFGEVAPVLGHAAEQRPQRQTARRIVGAMRAAHLEDGGEVPRSEGELERRTSEQRRAPVVQQRFHVSLHGTQDDQAAGRVAILKPVDLFLQQRRETAQRSAVADLKLVEDYDGSAGAQRAHRGSYPRQVADLVYRSGVRGQSSRAECAPEYRGEVGGAAVGDTDQQDARAGRLVFGDGLQRLLDEGGLADPAPPADRPEEPARPAHGLQEAAEFVPAPIESPGSAHSP